MALVTSSNEASFTSSNLDLDIDLVLIDSAIFFSDFFKFQMYNIYFYGKNLFAFDK